MAAAKGIRKSRLVMISYQTKGNVAGRAAATTLTSFFNMYYIPTSANLLTYHITLARSFVAELEHAMFFLSEYHNNLFICFTLIG